jgi:cell division protease FtsH
MASRPQKPQQGSAQMSRNLWIWWLVFVGLMVWNLVSFWPSARPEVAVPYSTFLAQVRADTVAKVHVAGAAITGTLVQPFVWPPSTPGAGPANTPESKASPSKPLPKPPPAAPAEPDPLAPTTYTAFLTTFPQAVGDPTLMPLLEAHHVVIDVAPPPTNWLAFVPIEGLPALLLIGFFVWMGRRAAMSQGGMFSFRRSKARRYSREQPPVTFADVAGVDEAKADLQEEVDLLRFPQKYHALGVRIPRGVLLVGAPGTGKTVLARADFAEDLDKGVLGAVHPRLADPRERRVVAYHESEHALVAWLTPAADPVHKVSIIPHGRALGVTAQMPPEDRYNVSVWP